MSKESPSKNELLELERAVRRPASAAKKRASVNLAGLPSSREVHPDAEQRGSGKHAPVTRTVTQRLRRASVSLTGNEASRASASGSDAFSDAVDSHPALRRSSSTSFLEGSNTFLRHLDLYNEAARHYAWKKRALELQKGNFRLRLQLVLEEPSTSKLAMFVAYLSAILIFGQVVLIMLETGAWGAKGAEEEEARYKRADVVMSVVFTVELLLRTYAATHWRVVLTSFFWWVDVIGVVPFYLERVLNLITDGSMSDGALGQVRDLLRLLRILRVLKVIRHHPDSAILFKALHMSARPLVVPLTFLAIGVTFFGSFVYYFEKLELGDEGAFPDMGIAVWFMLVTFSTVGYGDYSPNSHMGKALTSVAIVGGLVFMSMPLTIVGNNFSAVWMEKEKTAVVVKIQEHLIDRNLGLADVRRIFEEADFDQTGVINLREFSAFIQSMIQMEMSPSMMRRLFQVFDENQTGYISFFEFCHVIFPDLDVEEIVEGECDAGTEEASLKHAIEEASRKHAISISGGLIARGWSGDDMGDTAVDAQDDRDAQDGFRDADARSHHDRVGVDEHQNQDRDNHGAPEAERPQPQPQPQPEPEPEAPENLRRSRSRSRSQSPSVRIVEVLRADEAPREVPDDAAVEVSAVVAKGGAASLQLIEIEQSAPAAMAAGPSSSAMKPAISRKSSKPSADDPRSSSLKDSAVEELRAEIRQVEGNLLEALKHRDERQRLREREFEARLDLRMSEINKTLHQMERMIPGRARQRHTASGRPSDPLSHARAAEMHEKGVGGAAAAVMAARLDGQFSSQKEIAAASSNRPPTATSHANRDMVTSRPV